MSFLIAYNVKVYELFNYKHLKMIRITRQKNINKEIYYSFTLIEIKYINTTQVISLNVVLCGWLIKFTKTKDV